MKPTIKIISKYWNDLSLSVDLKVPSASSSLRRRASVVTIKIPRGGVVDVCAALGVDDLDEAKDIIKRSPELNRHRHLLHVVDEREHGRDETPPPPPMPELDWGDDDLLDEDDDDEV